MCNVRPFDVAVTIASVCMHTFRKNFLKPDTIATVPHGGYTRKDRHSKESLRWLKWVSHSENVDIRHAGNGREFKVDNLRVDGYCQETNTVYEYHGCPYHGCPKCFQDRWKVIPSVGVSLETAYQNTLSRAQVLRNSGVTLVEKWSCEFAADVKDDPELAEFLKDVGYVSDPLLPRDALRGARTNATILYHLCNETERMSYVDVCR